MDIHKNWADVKAVFHDSYKSSFHYAIATVNENGEPHVTPIGSLMLGKPGAGFYFEKFTRQLPRNLDNNKQVCILAVNSSRWFWLKSLLGGRFSSFPAIRLYGIAGDARQASGREIALWQNRVKEVKFTKGHALMWREMSVVREIEFTRVEPVHIGGMTHSLWQRYAIDDPA